MTDKLRIAWITAELTPFVKVGGLADVSTALPKAIHDYGHDVRIVLPYYGTIGEEFEINQTGITYKDPTDVTCEVFTGQLVDKEVPVYFLKHEAFSGSPYEDGDDLGRKFAIFSWLVSMLFDQVEWFPDIVHCNDWHTGLVPYILRETPVKSIYTIHNLAFQGIESVDNLDLLGIDRSQLNLDDTINYMKTGIQFSDKLTTVSETYAKEIFTEEYGFGLQDTLRNHKNSISGIVHGIDIDEYSPETDTLIPNNYSIENFKGKADNKEALQNRSNLPTKSSSLILGLVSRLYDQKGIHLLIEILPKLAELEIQTIILGTGDERYERELQRLEYSYPENIKFYKMYNVELSHQIFSGVDAFLVPSKFEPCGLTQLYAMCYGTIPIVRHTGGLADTVTEGGEDAEGFVFENFTSEDLYAAIQRAYTTFKEQPDYWRTMQKNGMSKDLTWSKPARKWIDLYENLI